MASRRTESRTQVAFRLPDVLLQRIDRHAQRLSDEHPGLTFTRVDVVMTLLTRALDQVETGAKQERKG